MGSTGTGRFTDYSEYNSSNKKTGGSSGNDPCKKAFSTSLEEVERSEYYINNQNVPPVGTTISISFNERILAKTNSNEIIGILSTRFNYLKVCIENGFSYSGIVSSSSLQPLPRITIDVTPNE